MNKGEFDLVTILRFLAIKVRVQGLHQMPTRTQTNPNALRNSLSNAGNYFFEKFGVHPPGINVLSHLTANFLITADFFNELSKNFQSLIKVLGEYVAGDEKLDKFTGNSGDIRKVPNKPAKIGLWHYELVGKVDSDTPYMIDMKMSQVNKNVDESERMADVVEHWTDTVQKINRNQPMETVLCFDSHYMDNASRKVLIDKKMKYIGAVKTGRFGKLYDLVKHDVTRPGEFAVSYNPETKELFTYHYDRNPDLGRKMVIGNALHHDNSKKQKKHIVPLYDEYSFCFSACDSFNKALSGKMWPHKKGGKGRLGDCAKQDDFAFTSLLLNIHCVSKESNKITNKKQSFRDFCLELSDEIFKFTCQ